MEHEFETRYDVVKWILDRQLDRRNLNNLKRTYLIGRRYLVEKLEEGNPNGFAKVNQLGQNDPVRSSVKIADQLSIGEKTVRRAAEFTLALDTVVLNTGIKVNDILDGKIYSKQQGVIALAELDKESQKRVIELILQDERDTVESILENELFNKTYKQLLNKINNFKYVTYVLFLRYTYEENNSLRILSNFSGLLGDRVLRKQH